MKEIIKQRVSALRNEMQNLKIDAWYISGTDPHSGEYLPDRWQTREFISGFTGSYGLVVVTKDKAALWTDTRYFLQAGSELEGTGIEMMKLRVPDAIAPELWLIQNLPEGSRVGVDAQTVSVAEFRNLQKILTKHNMILVETPDLFDVIWNSRPSIPKDKAFELELRYAGVSRKEKQQKVADKLGKAGAELQVVSMLDELAWLYNLRGSDILFNPVFTGYGWRRYKYPVCRRAENGYRINGKT